MEYQYPVVRILTEERSALGRVYQQEMTLGNLAADIEQIAQLLHEDLEDWTILLEVTTPDRTRVEEVESEALLELVSSIQDFLLSQEATPFQDDCNHGGKAHASLTIIPLLLLHFVLFEYDDNWTSLDKCIHLLRKYIDECQIPSSRDATDRPVLVHVALVRRLAQCLQLRSQQEEDQQSDLLAFFHEAVLKYEEAVELTRGAGGGSKWRQAALHDLASALWSGFQQQKYDSSILERVIATWTEYTAENVEPDLAIKIKLGSALSARYQLQTRSLHDIDDAVNWHCAAYEMAFLSAATAPSHPHPEQSQTDKLLSLRAYCTSLWLRYQGEGHADDLFQLIELLRKELELTSEGEDAEEDAVKDRAIALNRLAICLRNQTERSFSFHSESSLLVLQEAADLHTQALEILLPDDDDSAVTLSNLGQVFRFRYLVTDKKENLSTCILYQERALKSRPPGHDRRGISLFYLSESLVWRAMFNNSREDAERAVVLAEEATHIPPSDAPNILLSLQLAYVTALYTRGAVKEDKEDLDKAVHIARSLLRVPTDADANPSTLHTLATALRTRFHVVPELADLNEGITQYRRILELQDSAASNLWIYLTNLAGFLRIRAGATNNTNDLQEAIELNERAQSLCPTGHRLEASSLANYALTFGHSLSGSPSVQILKETLSLQQRVLELGTVEDRDRWLQLKQLGDSYMTLYAAETPRNASYLQDAVDCLRRSLNCCPFDGYERAQILRDIGSALCPLIIADPADERSAEKLQEVMNLYFEATKIVPPGHPRYIPLLAPFASRVFQARFLVHHDENDFVIATQAVCDFMRCRAVSVPTRLKFASHWLATDFVRDHAHTMPACTRCVSDMYDQVMELLPRLAYLAQDPKSRLEAIGLAPELTRGATLHAVSIGQFEKAVEYAEHGRAVFWSQALRLRAPIDQLKTKSPELYEKLSAKLQTLESESPREPSTTKTAETEEKLGMIQRLTDEFEALLEEVRHKVTGEERFMHPIAFEQLLSGLHGRTVVILVPGKSSCEVLVLNPPSRSNKIEHVSLTTVTATGIRRLGLVATQSAHRQTVDSTSTEIVDEELDGAGSSERAGRPRDRMSLEDVLFSLWVVVVKPIFDSLGIQKKSGRARPQLWWCPVGEAVFLPLHAAGRYKGSGADCTSNYVVSSYTPNLSYLVNASAGTLAGSETKDMKILLLSQPRARRQERLYNTSKEIRLIEQLVPQGSLLYLSASPGSLDSEGENTTTENVLAVLPQASIVHFACHGSQDPEDALSSGFEMRDDRLTALKLMRLKMPHAFFAFLSACQSASGSEEVPDEAVGLASTMLFVGFKSIVGTMWSMADVDGPRVAEAVYRALFMSEVLDPEVIPYALDEVIHKLRREGVSAARWACYTHTGI